MHGIIEEFKIMEELARKHSMKYLHSNQQSSSILYEVNCLFLMLYLAFFWLY